jgi:hypothetical protein
MKNRMMGPVAPSSSVGPVASFPEEGVIGSCSPVSPETAVACSSVLMESPLNSSGYGLLNRCLFAKAFQEKFGKSKKQYFQHITVVRQSQA